MNKLTLALFLGAVAAENTWKAGEGINWKIKNDGGDYSFLANVPI